MKTMDGTSFDDNAAIENARALLQKDCGISLPRDDAVLLVYLLAQHGIRDAIGRTQGTGLQLPATPANEKQVAPVNTQVIDELTTQVSQRVDEIQAKIGPIVDLSLATLMLGVEKSIDVHVNKVVEDCAIKFRAETKATARTTRFWPIMMLIGAGCFGAGVVTVLLIAKTFDPAITG